MTKVGRGEDCKAVDEAGGTTAPVWGDGDPWPVLTRASNCDCAGPAGPQGAPAPPRTSVRHKLDCCDQVFEALRCIPGIDQRCLARALDKPKVPPKVKLANLCGILPVRERIGPIMMLLLRRFRDGVPPGNDFEKSIQKFLAKLPAKQREALEHALDEYFAAPEPSRSCVWDTRFDAWPDERPVDPVFVAKNVGEMLLVFGQYLRDGTFDPPKPGRTRIWDQTFDAPGEPGKTVTKSGPWPWICAVSPSGQPGNVETGWFRNESARVPSNAPPGSIQYRGDEIAVDCQVIPGTPQTGGKAIAMCQPHLGGQSGFAMCTGGLDYETNAPDGSRLCIKIPEVTPGAEVALRGFNFTSPNATVWITKVGGGPKPFDRSFSVPIGSLSGDMSQPASVVSCGVRDIIHFTFPSSIPDKPGGLNDVALPPGLYQIQLQNPSIPTGGFAVNGTPKIQAMLSNMVLLDLQPDPNLAYQVRVTEAFCLEETDGPGGDDPWFTSMRASGDVLGSPSMDPFDMNFSTPIDICDTEGIEGGDAISIMGSDLYKDKPYHKLVALGIIGLEVDSEDAARAQVKTWLDAFMLYWQNFFVGVGTHAGGYALDKGLTGASLGFINPTALTILGGGALAALLISGVYFAFWAPADLLALDLIVLNSRSLYDATDNNTAALPPAEANHFEELNVGSTPLSKDLTFGADSSVYTQYRMYRNTSEHSTYRLKIVTRRA